MNVVVAGATGFIGAPLCTHLTGAGHRVVALCRNTEAARRRLGDAATLAQWDGATVGEWAAHVDGADAVVNLAGESIATGRWTAARKRVLRESRTAATAAVVDAIARAAQPPAVLVNASAIGWYGPHGDEPLEESAPAGTDFLASICVDWEAAARRAEPHCRVVLLRIGVVLGPGGGALSKMVLPFKMFFGGPLGNGRQQFSWIHRDDLIGIIVHAMDHGTLAGPVNGTAPEPLPLKEFCATLGRVMGRPSWAPVPAPVLKLLVGEMSDMLLNGQRVLPAAAQGSGYAFKYATAESALRAVLSA